MLLYGVLELHEDVTVELIGDLMVCQAQTARERPLGSSLAPVQ
jgi:hypothetical protein